MTNKDLRDIAAYWYAPVQVEVNGEVSDELTKVDWSLMHSIQSMEGLGIHHKLHLRPISSLTDEEKLYVLAIIGQNTGNVMFEYNTLVYYDSSAPINATVACAYFQSIGVYVPGTINEKYVELI